MYAASTVSATFADVVPRQPRHELDDERHADADRHAHHSIVDEVTQRAARTENSPLTRAVTAAV